MFRLFQKIMGNEPDFKAILAAGALIIDVRTPGEFAAGHIKGSTNIPLDVINTQTQELKKKGKPIITVCRSGNRSGIAKSMLKASGIEAYNGGAWKSFANKAGL